ncbi:phytoene/squalene synthase family protein [Bacteroidota bacterium]
MKALYDEISNESSKIITKNYSTSFSIAVRLLAPSIRQAIYNIYGFVRIADEIVDSFEGYPKEELLNRFEEEYFLSLQNGISTNPVVNAFTQTVVKYNIDKKLVNAFLKSMRADLTKQIYKSEEEVANYIYGSADVVGLMCLKVFVKGDEKSYEKLKEPAMKLGSAFQKVNFLRDMKQDYEELSRTYFPEINPDTLSNKDKKRIIKEIKLEFDEAYNGIKKLPKEARLGVFVAYRYYLKLLKKIENTPAKVLSEKRIRISNSLKTYLLFRSYIKFQLRYA